MAGEDAFEAGERTANIRWPTGGQPVMPSSGSARQPTSPRLSSSWPARPAAGSTARPSENWLRNLGAARAARVRALLQGERVDVDATEAVLGYRLRQHHVGLVCWLRNPEPGGHALARLGRATMELAGQVRCEGRPIFLPQDESCAWAWLPLGARDSFAAPPRHGGAAGAEPGIWFAFGAPGAGVAGFCRSHHQALGAHAVALAAGPSGQRMTSFTEVAPLALMASSTELLRTWVIETLGSLADDDDHNARLRDTSASSCRRTAATRPPPSASSCTRTASSTASAKPRRRSAIPSTSIASTSNWPCWQANGSAPPSCGSRKRLDHDGPACTSQPRSPPTPSAWRASASRRGAGRQHGCQSLTGHLMLARLSGSSTPAPR
jgi:hypothetical protein